MSRFACRAVFVASMALAIATPAFAIFPQQSTPLTGPALNGVVPQGQAKVDQSGLPKVAGTLTLEVKNVNLPDGTALLVEPDGTLVGTVNLIRGQGKVSTTLPSQVGRNSVLKVGTGGVVVLMNVSAWKI
jgi:hypothetical protein